MNMRRIFLNLVAVSVNLCFTSSVVQAAPPAGSPYFTDIQSTYNKDASAEAFMVVSVVSCYVRAMAPEKAFNVVGSSPYVALIDASLCESSNQASSGTGSVVQTKKYETALIEASVNNGVLEGKIWLKGNNDNDPEKTWVSIKIVGGAAKVPPFGDWEVNWCDGFDDATKNCKTLGHAKVGPNGSRAFLSDFDDNIQEERAVVGSLAADMRSGGGKYRKFTEWLDGSNSPQTTEGYYSFDATRLFQNQGATGDRCLIPNSDDPGAKVSSWETWLYDASTGQRFDVNSGFSIKDQNGSWGYAGEWGVSIGNRSMVQGETVYKVDSSGNRQATYTVAVSNGKLYKVENKSSKLKALDGIPLRSYGPKSLLGPASNEWMNFNMYWDEASSKFYISGYDQCNSEGCFFQNLDTAISYSIPVLTDETGLNLNHFWAYQEGTNNSMTIILSDWREQNGSWERTVYGNSSDVVVQTQQRILMPPGRADIPSNLVCIGNCVDGSLNSDIDNGFVSKLDLDNKIGSRTYQWDSSIGMLKVGTKELDFSEFKDSFFSSGVLVATADLPKLVCRQWDGSSYVDGYCHWNADSMLETYYRWESGSSTWSKFTGLKDSSQEIVTFEPPITVSFKVPSTDRSAYKGKTVNIQYAGSGSLWIPGYCYSTTTGKRASCGDGTDWANEFNIPFDTEIGVVHTTNGKPYLVKTLKRGVGYPDASADLSDTSSCNSLRSSAAVYDSKSLPTRADWKNPADPSSSNFIGAWRESKDPPLVIDGELQR